MPYRSAVLACLLAAPAPFLAASAALAQNYPFEGRWREGANDCEGGIVISATHMNQPIVNSVCRFTGVKQAGPGTYSYELRCNDNVGHNGGRDWNTGGTIRVVSGTRIQVRDRQMRGSTTTYDRC